MKFSLLILAIGLFFLTQALGQETRTYQMTKMKFIYDQKDTALKGCEDSEGKFRSCYTVTSEGCKKSIDRVFTACVRTKMGPMPDVVSFKDAKDLSATAEPLTKCTREAYLVENITSISTDAKCSQMMIEASMLLRSSNK